LPERPSPRRSSLSPRRSRQAGPRGASLEIVALTLAVAAVAGCDGSAGADGGRCDSLDEQCGGASDCFAACACRGGDGEACRTTCGLPSDSPLLIDVSNWAASPDETTLLVLVNALRAKGGCCATGVCFGPSQPLVANVELTSAARRHSADMAARAYFSHDTPEGLTAFDRIRAAGFRGCVIGEDLAAEYSTANDVLAAWLASTDHCENLLWPAFSEVGVAGAVGPPAGPGMVWTVDFGG